MFSLRPMFPPVLLPPVWNSLEWGWPGMIRQSGSDAVCFVCGRLEDGRMLVKSGAVPNASIATMGKICFTF